MLDMFRQKQWNLQIAQLQQGNLTFKLFEFFWVSPHLFVLRELRVHHVPQLSSEDISASLGEESLLEDRDEEPQQESKHAPHPAGQKRPQSALSCVTITNP